MKTEHDLDRLLTDWFAEGADRAPEWAVWSAVDQVAQTPQRPRWRRRLDEILSRLTSPTRLPVAAAAALVLAVVFVMVRYGAGPGGTPARTLTAQDLPTIVVWEETMPSDWTLDTLISNADEVLVIPVRSTTPEQFAARESVTGYVGGRYTNFTGSDAVFISWATLFETVPQADAALDAYLFELGSEAGWGVGPEMPVELGDEGYLLTGETRVLQPGPPHEPVPMQIYLWRRSNVLLALGGWFEYDPDQLLDVARGMDDRAR